MEDWKYRRIEDKKRFISHFIFLVCCLSFSSWCNHTYSQSQSTLEASYRSADALYQGGQYQQAAEKYEQIVDSIQNGAVYYNLGNAYFRLGNRGKAILNYERAKRLMPRDKDTNFNLKVAKARNVDSFDLVKPLSGFSLLYGALHPNEIVWVGLIPYWIAAISLIVIQFIQNHHFQRALRYVVLIGCIGWLFSLLVLGLKIREINLPYAIVVANEVMVRSEPDLGSETIALPLHEGTKIQLQEKRNDWVKIYLPNENSGWLSADAIEKI